MLHNAQNLKDDYDSENSAWRQALAEKARKQLSDKEQQLRTTLESERDQQIDLVRPEVLFQRSMWEQATAQQNTLFAGHSTA